MIVKHRFLTRRIDRLIGPVLSGALAASVAFFVLAMPADLVGDLLMAPPVDMASRLLVMLVAAALFGGAAYAAFAWLDRKPMPPREEPEELDFEDVEFHDAAAAAVTRGDAPPRPIFADRDLGAPAPAPDEADDALELEVPLTSAVEAVLAEPADDTASAETASLDELMRRLEQGIAGRDSRSISTKADDAGRDALRDTLDQLQRMAARTR